MKKKKREKDSSGTVLIALILIGAFLYFNGNPFSIITEENQTCSDYDFADEFLNKFGDTNMTTLKVTCQRSGGVWYNKENNVGCSFPSALEIDCNTQIMQPFKEFCEEGVYGNYVCDNHEHYIGCLCNRDTPDCIDCNEEQGQEQDEEEYTCAFNIATAQCGGTCPAYQKCHQITPVYCGCVDDESQYTKGQVGTIFVTSNTWSGAIGGLAGADDKCQASAQYAGLAGTWRAIAGDTETTPSSRLIDTLYYTLQGRVIADGIGDLFDGSIKVPINVDEHMNIQSSKDVWTGSYETGNIPALKTQTCNDWKWVSEGYEGIYGNTGNTDGKWIYVQSKPCYDSGKLYCMRVA